MNSMKSLMREVYHLSSKTVDESCGDAAENVSRKTGLLRRMENPSAAGKITGHCGETMEIYLRIAGEHITDSSFFTDGCRFSIICGAVAATLARDKTIDDAAEVGGDTILGMFQEIPEEESHCAHLAAETLHAAIHDWMLKS
ncbi:MAG: iron-sulfur cluster assembly scaffold protein [Syntrophobacteraceae bacterium]